MPTGFPTPADVVELLKAQGHTVAWCESLTAGLAAATMANVPGASSVLRGGLITYATDLKESLAGVPGAIIDAHGVVSAECATAMARGTRHACDATWGVSLTGVAGPDTQDGQPVGTVFIGVAGPQGTHVFRAGQQQPIVEGSDSNDTALSGDRNSIRQQAVQWANLFLHSCVSAHATGQFYWDEQGK